MAMTIDHLGVDRYIEVTQAFEDARGVAHAVGERGTITALAYQSATGEITLTWNRDGQSESMTFLLASKSGPGNGRMKQYFDVIEDRFTLPTDRRYVEGVGTIMLLPTVPPLTDALITDDHQFDEAIRRVWALAFRKRFVEAAAQLQAIVYSANRRGDNTERAAELLCHAAHQHAFDPDASVYRWLREQGVQLWYSWGSQATSGGEGSDRARYIRAAEAKFTALDRARNEPTP